jgi:stearoyl-CoA desaturase (delta-9 desaturase)
MGAGTNFLGGTIEVISMQHTASQPQPLPSGITVLDDRQARFQRALVVVLTVVPFAAFVLALWTLWGTGISEIDIGVLVSCYLFSGLGVTVGFHRLFAHHSFEARPSVRALLALAGTTALQGSVIGWVAAHRRHHAYSDKAGDPHSPHLEEEEGVKGLLKGLWHAHLGWLFDIEKSSRARWAPELLKDPVLVRIDRWFPQVGAISFVLIWVCGLLLTGTWQGATTALLWGGPVRIFLLHHVTWSVNSICHYYGTRPFDTSDHSANNWPLSLLSMGESWHNNHHAFPASARHGLGRGQVDISAATIGLLQKLGLVHRVRQPSARQLAARRRAS